MLSCCDSGWWKSENIEINIDDDIDGTNPSSPLGFHACLFVFFCFGAKNGGTIRCIGAKTGSVLQPTDGAQPKPNPNPLLKSW
jgi:hypothetical protein